MKVSAIKFVATAAIIMLRSPSGEHLGDDDIEGIDDLSDTTVWHRYTAVWNGKVMGTRQLRIDGNLDYGINLVGDFSPFTVANNVHVVFGGQEQSGGVSSGFAGLLYDVPIYNGALSTVGIQGLLNPAGSSGPAPVLTAKSWAGNQIRISWPVAATGYSLQQATNLLGSLDKLRAFQCGGGKGKRALLDLDE